MYVSVWIGDQHYNHSSRAIERSWQSFACWSCINRWQVAANSCYNIFPIGRLCKIFSRHDYKVGILSIITKNSVPLGLVLYLINHQFCSLLADVVQPWPIFMYIKNIENNICIRQSFVPFMKVMLKSPYFTIEIALWNPLKNHFKNQKMIYWFWASQIVVVVHLSHRLH